MNCGIKSNLNRQNKAMAKIKVQDTEITVSNVNGEDYICITDMLKAKDGDFFVTDWLRNRNTMEFLGVWERIYNHLITFELDLHSLKMAEVYEQDLLEIVFGYNLELWHLIKMSFLLIISYF